jgi:pyruvate kinase
MLRPNKTKIVCTIGPASGDVQTLERMIRAGMNVARLNFSHGDLAGHRRVIENIRAAAKAVARRVAIMADLPGPKLRVGQLAQEPIELLQGEELVLTTQDVAGDCRRVSVSFAGLPGAVRTGDTLFLNDGLIELTVLGGSGDEVRCKVLKDNVRQDQVSVVDVLALGVERTVERAGPVAVIIPTRSGATARSVARFRLPVWISAFSPAEATCQALQFSYGVEPVRVDTDLADWTTFARDWLRGMGLTTGLAVLTQGPSAENPCGNHRMEIVELDR